MEEAPINQILERLRAREHEDAWALFLREYGSLTFQVVRHFESDADNASDCFQFVCEQLVKDSFHRLRKFEPDGPAVFSTWLRAVVRNLCIDWQRKQFGRRQELRSISQLSDSEHAAASVVDPCLDPEARAILEERRTLIRGAMSRLPKRERLLLRLRFEEELTLEQIAKLLELGNAQRADRQIKEVLARLQNEIGEPAANSRGKNPSASVKALRRVQ